MDDKKWQEYIKRMPAEYNDRGPNAPIDFDPQDRCLPIADVNQKILDNCNSVVDLGCGVGRALQLLKKKGKFVRGMTLDSREVKAGIEQYGLTEEEIILGDVHETPWDDETFDGAIMWEILEHVLSPIISLWECWRLLKPGGKLLLFLPNKVYVDVGVHVICPNIDQTRALLTKTWFKITDVIDHTGESGRYTAIKVPRDTSEEELRQHNKSVPLRHWSELILE